jgi:hypothetical protein
MYECIVFDMVGLVDFVAQLEFHFALLQNRITIFVWVRSAWLN